MTIDDLKRDWEDLAELDPFWAILSVPDRQYGKWDIDEFFKTGQNEVDRLFHDIEGLGYPEKFSRVLDFGCGVGRLSRALSKKFEECVGVDISTKMISMAIGLNSSFPNCKFIHNEKADLSIFEDNYFDMIYTSIVLQHISDISITKSYISEFVRILKKGGLLVFQLPNYIPPDLRTQTLAMEFSNLRKNGEDAKFLYETRKINPIRMNFVPESEVILLLVSHNAKIVQTRDYKMSGPKIESKMYFVTK